jgi:hypothetical protein
MGRGRSRTTRQYPLMSMSGTGASCRISHRTPGNLLEDGLLNRRCEIHLSVTEH